jgi:hypothetical protein
MALQKKWAWGERCSFYQKADFTSRGKGIFSLCFRVIDFE